MGRMDRFIAPEEDSFERRRHSRERREAHKARRLALGLRMLSDEEEDEEEDDALDKGRDRDDIYRPDLATDADEKIGWNFGDET
jgi:hypothetical protein